MSSTSTHDLPDQALGRRLAAGDQRALRTVFDALHAPLLGFARSLVRDEAVADDLVQEAFVRLWEHRASLAADGSVRAWLYRTVRNAAFNHARDRRTRGGLLERAAPEFADGGAGGLGVAPPPPDRQLEAAELARQLADGIAALPPRQREALQLSRVRGLSHQEIADVMGCAPRTVNNHLVRALDTLRRRLGVGGALVASLAGLLA